MLYAFHAATVSSMSTPGVPMQTTVTPQVRTEVQLHARREGLKPSDIIRRALLEWLDRNPIGPRVGATQPSLFQEHTP